MHGEFVTAEARDGVAGPHRGDESLRDEHQQPVALGVAEPIVDRLEVVEIEIEDGRRQRAARCARERVRESIPEQ